MSMTTEEQLERLSKRWRNHISDPAPEASIFTNLIDRYGYPCVSHGVDAAIRRYSKGGMDYDYAVRYMASAARNKEQEKTAFRPPADWLRNSE